MISTELYGRMSQGTNITIFLASICIESTDGNFGTHEKVAIPIPIVTCTLPIPIPIFGIFVFPFLWDSHGNPMGTGIPFPRTSLLLTSHQYHLTHSYSHHYHHHYHRRRDVFVQKQQMHEKLLNNS